MTSRSRPCRAGCDQEFYNRGSPSPSVSAESNAGQERPLQGFNRTLHQMTYDLGAAAITVIGRLLLA